MTKKIQPVKDISLFLTLFLFISMKSFLSVSDETFTVERDSAYVLDVSVVEYYFVDGLVVV